jgi:hypothetical protein
MPDFLYSDVVKKPQPLPVFGSRTLMGGVLQIATPISTASGGSEQRSGGAALVENVPSRVIA